MRTSGRWAVVGDRYTTSCDSLQEIATTFVGCNGHRFIRCFKSSVGILSILVCIAYCLCSLLKALGFSDKAKIHTILQKLTKNSNCCGLTIAIFKQHKEVNKVSRHLYVVDLHEMFLKDKDNLTQPCSLTFVGAQLGKHRNSEQQQTFFYVVRPHSKNVTKIFFVLSGLFFTRLTLGVTSWFKVQLQNVGLVSKKIFLHANEIKKDQRAYFYLLSQFMVASNTY